MSFETALPIILAHEGGFVDHPADRGGPTKQGITQRVYDNYRMTSSKPTRSVRDIDGNEVAKIYKAHYWDKAGCGVMPDKLSLCQFDAAVNHGPVRAIRLLQQALHVGEDGFIGPHTLEAMADTLHAHGEPALIVRMLQARADFYNDIVASDPTQAVFSNGWSNRLARLRKEVGL